MTSEHSLIAELTRLVPPPSEVGEWGGDWDAVEESLGVRLPSDFKALVATYGPGAFFDEVRLRTPLSHHNPCQLTGDLLDDYESLREMAPQDFPYPLYPERGGLIEWASSGNGDKLCWATVGDPDSWPVVIWSEDCKYEEYGSRAVAFLEGWASGRIVSHLLPIPHGDPTARFVPARRLGRVHVELTGEALPYRERLRILRDALGPTVGPGPWEFEFAAVDGDWKVHYATGRSHHICVAFPPEDNERARVAVLHAVELMGCEVRSLQTVQGTASWIPLS